MQSDCQHERIRRRRVADSPYQILLPTFVAVATAVLCLSGTNSSTAFIPASSVWGPRSAALRQSVRTAAPSSIFSLARGKRQQVSRMVLGESATAACRRMLQRAWRASPAETVFNEMDESPVFESERELDLRLTTFNLLAPCYKRIHNEVPVAAMAAAAGSGTGLLASQAKKHHTPRESEFHELWRERAMQTVDFIKQDMTSSDIICLQEFWFEPAYDEIFRSALSDTYEFHTLQRTGEKADGVAILLRRGKWDVASSLGLSLSPVGDRVALAMHLRSRGASGIAPGEDMILVNTHLAFPHNALDRANQIMQIKSITEAVEAVVSEAGLPTMTPRVVVGDLNVEETDPVCRHLGTNGFRSAFACLHREQRVITHRNHRGEEVMVDHVFVKAPGFSGRRRGEASHVASEIPGLVARLHEDVSVEEAMLLPGGVDAASWCSRFCLSDHRPLTVRLKFPAD